MKKIFVFSFVLFLLLNVSSIIIVVASSEMWDQTYGGTGFDGANALIGTSDGGFALAGGTDSFGAGQVDFWLVKTDGSGNVEWNQTYGGAENNDEAYALVGTSDGGFAIAGFTDSFGAGDADFWLVKTDGSGNVEWNQTYGGAENNFAYALVGTSDGGFAIAGGAASGTGDADFWLVKTDGSGNVEWNQTYGGTGFDGAYALIGTSDGGFAIAGETDSFGAGDDDFWLVKTDENGIIPEFSSEIILPLFLCVTLFIIILKKIRPQLAE